MALAFGSLEGVEGDGPGRSGSVEGAQAVLDAQSVFGAFSDLPI